MTYDDRHKARPTASRQPTRADVAAAQDYDEDEDEYEEYGEVYPPRQPTSSRRYATSERPAPSYGQPQVVIPRRTSSMASPPTPSRRLERDPLATRVLPRRQRRRFSAEWLLTLAGAAMLIMLLGWVALTALGGWWQVHQDDVTYGRPRTFQTDAVVGHNGDSAAHPSHFIALNLARQVVVVEMPAGDPSKAILYSGPTLMGDGQDLTPITLTFSDVNGDGKLDMQVHILNQVIVYLNTNGKFVAQQH